MIKQVQFEEKLTGQEMESKRLIFKQSDRKKQKCEIRYELNWIFFTLQPIVKGTSSKVFPREFFDQSMLKHFFVDLIQSIPQNHLTLNKEFERSDRLKSCHDRSPIWDWNVSFCFSLCSSIFDSLKIFWHCFSTLCIFLSWDNLYHWQEKLSRKEMNISTGWTTVSIFHIDMLQLIFLPSSNTELNENEWFLLSIISNEFKT